MQFDTISERLFALLQGRPFVASREGHWCYASLPSYKQVHPDDGRP